MIYEFQCRRCHTVHELLYPASEAPALGDAVRLNDPCQCGELDVHRVLSRIRVVSKSAGIGEKWSDQKHGEHTIGCRFAVNPKQIPYAIEQSKKWGCPVEFKDDGRVIYSGNRNQEQYNQRRLALMEQNTGLGKEVKLDDGFDDSSLPEHVRE